jgi:site-specific recombinase XerD
MTTLRKKLIQELVLRGYSPKTEEAYVAAVAGLAKFYNRGPEMLADEEIKAYLFALHTEGCRAASTLNVAVSGLRFFYRHVLGRPFESIESGLPRVKKPIRRPRIYSREEIARLLKIGCHHPKHRVFLMTVYSAGMRLNEACHLKLEDIESDRMQIRVEQGKGRKDRYTILSQYLLEELRRYWRCFRPRLWLFPGSRDSQKPLSDGTAQKIFYKSLRRAGLANKGGIHCLRHSFATHLMESGVEIHVLKRLMGHSSLSTTAGYLHVTQQQMTRIKSPLDAIDFSTDLSAKEVSLSQS